MTTPAGQAPRLRGAAAAAEAITAARLIAIVRTHRSEDAVRAVRVLAAAGVQVAEISLSTPGALEALERSAEDVGDRVLLGAGTVRSERDAAQALSAGACFLVSPSLDGGVVAYARESDVLHLPGVMSPTELAGALAGGAQLVKLFPAARLGAGYVRDLLAPFPEARLVPPAASPTPTSARFSTPGPLRSRSARTLSAQRQSPIQTRLPAARRSFYHSSYPHPRREIQWRLKASFRSSPRRC